MSVLRWLRVWFVLGVALLLVSCPASWNGGQSVYPSAEGPAGEVVSIAEAEVSDGEPDEELFEDAEEEDGGADVGPDGLYDEVRLGHLVPLEPGPLEHFFEALNLLEEGGEGKVRVLHYGDSHTAGDILPSQIRRALQSRFGDGGRGFVLLGKPWKHYSPLDIQLTAHGEWKTHRIMSGRDPLTMDGRYGLGGVAVEILEKKAGAGIHPSQATAFGNSFSKVELFFMTQPSGGTFTIIVDGKKHGIQKTRGKVGTGVHTVEFEDGAHSVELKTWKSGEIRLFGAAVERKSGVVYDTLGINGAFFRTPLAWDADMLAEQVKMRDPRLIVTMYGSNAVNIKTFDDERYRTQVREALSRIRAGAPLASCLLVGPPDRDTMVDEEDKSDQLARIIGIQRDAAAAEGCAFIDAQALMGGPGTFMRWQIRGLSKPDGVHFAADGYTLLGQAIAAQLMAAYEQYLTDQQNPDALEEASPEPDALEEASESGASLEASFE